MKAAARLGTALVWAALLAGCSSFSDRMAPAEEAFAAGRYDEAATLLRQLKRDDAKNAHVYALNLGVGELALGATGNARGEWRFARDRMEELSTTDVTTWFGAVLTDDTALDYPGEDYERILVRAMLALADLLGGGGDADAFALQVLEKQLEIMESFADESGARPKQAYRLVAFGSYLRGILNEDNPLTRSVAEREFRRVLELAPEFPHARADLARVTEGRFCAPGHGVVHVLALVGRGPFKVEAEEPASAAALGIAQWAWGLHRDRVTFPNLTSVKIPALAVRGDNPTEALVEIDGQPAGQTATVTDVNATALQQFETVKSWIVARAILRRVFKITAQEGVKEATDAVVDHQGGQYGWIIRFVKNLFIDILGLLWTSAERADTRCWSLLPASFQALRLELPAGEHTLTLAASQNGRAAGATPPVTIRVRDGFSTYVVALLPTLAGGPPPLASDAPEERGAPALQP
ncbi:MAG: hypothetical protein JXQ29_07865 [Planctomycetes bacterium]|nr:hypothetical protein [Planctomycetota bacterium]